MAPRAWPFLPSSILWLILGQKTQPAPVPPTPSTQTSRRERTDPRNGKRLIRPGDRGVGYDWRLFVNGYGRNAERRQNRAGGLRVRPKEGNDSTELQTRCSGDGRGCRGRRGGRSFWGSHHNRKIERIACQPKQRRRGRRPALRGKQPSRNDSTSKLWIGSAGAVPRFPRGNKTGP